MMINSSCSSKDCHGKVVARGLCGNCYARLRRNGTTAYKSKQSAKGDGLRFLEGIDCTDECIFWPFGKGSNGYGVFYFRGKQTTASRASCEIHNGPPPDSNMEAAHSCGRGHLGCVNPRHLSWKTVKENTEDKFRHGTVLSGTRHPSARLSPDDVRYIRKNYQSEGRQNIAKKFGISAHYAWEIYKMKSWRTVV